MKPYEKYKDSGIEWLGQIPEHWIKVKLGRAFQSIGSGTTPKTANDSYYEDGTINWLNTGDLNDGFIYSTSKRITEEAFRDHSVLRLYPIDSIVIALYGATIGKLGHLKIETTTNQACCVISESKEITNRYIFYYLLAAKEFIISKSYGGGQPNISQDTIKQLYIVAPTLSEQTQIANYLDHQTAIIDQLIAQKEKLISLLKDKRQAVIKKAVTKGLNLNTPMKDSGVEWLGELPERWELVKFKHIAKIRNGKDQKDVQVEEGGYPVLGTGGEFGRASKFLYDKPSVLLGRKGTIDKPQYIEQPFWTVDTLFYTEISEDCDPLYVFYLSQQIPFSLLQESSAVPSMTQDNLNNVVLCKPPLREQQEISVMLKERQNEFDVLIEISNLQITNLKSFRQSLISEAVTGKVNVRDWKPVNLNVSSPEMADKLQISTRAIEKQNGKL